MIVARRVGPAIEVLRAIDLDNIPTTDDRHDIITAAVVTSRIHLCTKHKIIKCVDSRVVTIGLLYTPTLIVVPGE